MIPIWVYWDLITCNYMYIFWVIKLDLCLFSSCCICGFPWLSMSCGILACCNSWIWGTLGWEEMPREYSKTHGPHVAMPCHACCHTLPMLVPVFFGKMSDVGVNLWRGLASGKGGCEREEEESLSLSLREWETEHAWERERERRRSCWPKEEESSPTYLSTRPNSFLFPLITYEIIGNMLYS